MSFVITLALFCYVCVFLRFCFVASILCAAAFYSLKIELVYWFGKLPAEIHQKPW